MPSRKKPPVGPSQVLVVRFQFVGVHGPGRFGELVRCSDADLLEHAAVGVLHEFRRDTEVLRDLV